MKISLAQTKPFRGDILKNIESHINIIKLALEFKPDLMVFPELSLTGYEPRMAKNLAIELEDNILNEFQEISDKNKLIIGVGMPVKNNSGIHISTIFFQPEKPRTAYSKQYLHEDEKAFFTNGKNELFLELNKSVIAPAICYESLLPVHAEKAFNSGAEIYIASVAKSYKGIEKALNYFPGMARKYSMFVFMVNSVGVCDDFECKGKSSIWNKNGTLVGQLNGFSEGVLIFDTDTNQLIQRDFHSEI